MPTTPANSVPYPQPPPGWAQEISRSLRGGWLPASVAEACLAQGAPWELVAKHVADRAWWLAQPAQKAPPLRRTWRIAAWEATLHLQTDDVSVWVDPGPSTYSWPDRPPDLVLVTHAHYDHTARLGELFTRWPDVLVAMSHETAQLLALRCHDSPLQACVQQAARLSFHAPRQLGGINICLLPAGHLLGAAMIELEVNGDRILITGDFALREVGGVPGAALPTGEYNLILMESTYAPWQDLPAADERTTRQPLLQQVAQAQTGRHPVLILAHSLGQVQEAYAALVMAHAAGAWTPETKVRIAGYAAAVSEQYYAALSTVTPVWRYRPYGLVSREVPPDSLLLASSSAAAETEHPWLAPTDHSLIVLPQPTIHTHAGWAERVALVRGTRCGQIGLYHGNAPDLRLFFSQCGYDVLPNLSWEKPWTNKS